MRKYHGYIYRLLVYPTKFEAENKEAAIEHLKEKGKDLGSSDFPFISEEEIILDGKTVHLENYSVEAHY